ncbi:threonine synthase [Marinilongibacter aquaticus]|nr:threonine synthase [Marinilongibacter aquaticus]
MQFYSTNGKSKEVGIEEAIFQGLPPDNGLYMPKEIPCLSQEFWDTCDTLTFNQIAFEIASAFFGQEIPKEELQALINQAYDFDAPSVELTEGLYCLELFHGPSMAFKDFGARFMAAVMSYFLKKNNRDIHILVATSGDTGGAVAQGFFGVDQIQVHILYPKGKVSEIQEKQLTTLGANVKAYEVDGTFDDCQRLVKSTFLDEELREKYNLASANSINIARLIPQSFYYAYTYSRLKKKGLPIVFSVPSGNFGNISAGIIAAKMGMPVHQFIAATNVNKVVPAYLESGIFEPINPSISTISNAMDVGNPSNFPRMKALYGDDYSEVKKHVKGYFYTDEETKAAIKKIDEKYGYLVCPHTAIAYLGLQDYLKTEEEPVSAVFLSTAHYAKFLPDVEAVLGRELAIPERLQSLLSKKKEARALETDYAGFKAFLLKNL